MTEEAFLFTFESTHDAMACQALLENLAPVIMPTPRAIRASCGMSLRFTPETIDLARVRMSAAPGPWQLWRVTERGYDPIAEGRV